MESNRDEAERCIHIAAQALRDSKLDRAEKFLNKAEKLYPTQKAKGSFNKFTQYIFSDFEMNGVQCQIYQIYWKGFWLLQGKTKMKTIRYQQMGVQLVEGLRRVNHRHVMRTKLNQTTHPNNYNMLKELKGKHSFSRDLIFRFQQLPFHFNSCKDYYEVLKVTKDATDTEIKKSYKKIALVLHPGTFRWP